MTNRKIYLTNYLIRITMENTERGVFMTGLTIPLILLALVGGFTALILYGSYDHKSKVGNGQFDERQLRAQGRAYMWGFYTMAAAGFGVLVLDTLREGVLIPGQAAVFILSPGVAVMAVYCVIHDAYVSLKGSAPVCAVSSGLLSAVCLTRGFEKLGESGVLTEGRLGPCWAHFALGAASLAVFVSLLVKLLLDWRNRE